MATVSHWTTSWQGQGLQPGGEHHWWMVPVHHQDVIAVSAHPLTIIPYTPPPPVELLVTNERSRINNGSGVDPGGRVFLFTVRNTGPNRIVAYYVNFSWVNA